MAKDKSIVVSARTHEILRREVIARNNKSLTDMSGNEVNIKTLIGEIAETMQGERNWQDLPEATK